MYIICLHTCGLRSASERSTSTKIGLCEINTLHSRILCVHALNECIFLVENLEMINENEKKQQKKTKTQHTILYSRKRTIKYSFSLFSAKNLNKLFFFQLSAQSPFVLYLHTHTHIYIYTVILSLESTVIVYPVFCIRYPYTRVCFFVFVVVLGLISF